jgi:hypothetical protein
VKTTITINPLDHKLLILAVEHLRESQNTVNGLLIRIAAQNGFNLAEYDFDLATGQFTPKPEPPAPSGV